MNTNTSTTATTGQIRTLFQNHPWQARLVFAVLIIFLVLAVVRIALPYTIIYSATYWLDSQGVSSQIKDISIDVDEGTFTIHEASGSINGSPVFKVGKASIDWEWRPLSNKTIHITSITLQDFNLHVTQYSNAIAIAGVVIQNDSETKLPDTKDDQAVAWGASLNQIDLSRLGFCYQQFDTPIDAATDENKRLDYCGNVDLITWKGSFNFDNAGTQQTAAAEKLTLDGSLRIRQLRLHNNSLDATLISLGDTSLSNIELNGINDIKLDSLNISQLTLMQRSGHSSHEHAVRFDNLAISGISVSNIDSVAISSITLDKPVISMARNETGAWKYEQWLPPEITTVNATTQKTEQQAAGEKHADSPFNIKLGNIKLGDVEACYQQQASKSGKSITALDYCLFLASGDWGGDIAVTTATAKNPLALVLNGSLALNKFISSNNLLHRDLLTFDKLAVNKIALKDIEDVAFTSLELDNATGLELTSAENKHTLSITRLDISTFSYRNNAVAIDKVAVNDLGLELTQNKDGSLDIDQWKLALAEQKSEDRAEAKQTATEPIKIKLGEFSLNSTRIIEFTDLSVTPAMVIGFNQIQATIKDLDSDKPKQKSPIMLKAQTTRHATVDVNGVVMPFDSKPSFDASGKISGLDLRAASPKAEQAIGHVIKSGQLDANLKLLSNEGQLDSKVSLVLHHFNLKAKSKQDAAALDELFGMPINQSLMLLKDKSGTIKLDIPVTGDINNPDFNPTDAIIKATTKATTVTLITFYTPYGLAYAGGNVLFNIATAMNFDPLVFDPGSSQLTDTHKQQLTKLAELLTKRPQVHLTLCGFTNLDDRDRLFTEILDKKKVVPISPERLVKLKQLASERQDRVKDYLISAGNIKHDRLVLCEPEHSDEAGALAGVEISI